MAKSSGDPHARIRRAARDHFGVSRLRIEAPGGSSRASCRIWIDGRSVIGTRRPNFRRTHLEAAVLRALSPVCPHVPEFLGLVDDVLFQGDVGGQRLNCLIAEREGLEREDLADQSVEAIFRIQAAARDALRDVPVPPLGGSPTWIAAHVDAMDAVAAYGPGVPSNIDRAALCERLAVTPRQFVKWDCRSGNAAMADDGRLSWFDFEYCGRRHGAEDLAFLIADEVWTVPPATMLDIVRDNHRDFVTDQDFDSYAAYLSLYTTFHALQRLGLILDEVRKRGWRSMKRIRDRDDVGKHPAFVVNIARIGAFFAERDPMTRPLVPALDAVAQHFTVIEREGRLGRGLSALERA